MHRPASHSASRAGPSLPRRRLLAGGAAELIPAVVTRRSAGAATAGPNETILVAAIGIGRHARGRGRLLVEQLPPDGRIVAVCDCDLPAAGRFKAESTAANKDTWDVVSDYRRILTVGTSTP